MSMKKRIITILLLLSWLLVACSSTEFDMATIKFPDETTKTINVESYTVGSVLIHIKTDTSQEYCVAPQNVVFYKSVEKIIEDTRKIDMKTLSEIIASMGCCRGVVGGTSATDYLSEMCISCPYLVLVKEIE